MGGGAGGVAEQQRQQRQRACCDARVVSSSGRHCVLLVQLCGDCVCIDSCAVTAFCGPKPPSVGGGQNGWQLLTATGAPPYASPATAATVPSNALVNDTPPPPRLNITHHKHVGRVVGRWVGLDRRHEASWRVEQPAGGSDPESETGRRGLRGWR